jgi:hypothetical protein
LVLHTPVTSVPYDLAICTENVPTAPEAPLIKTYWPGLTCPKSRRQIKAVDAEQGMAAASSNDILAGFCTIRI